MKLLTGNRHNDHFSAFGHRRYVINQTEFLEPKPVCRRNGIKARYRMSRCSLFNQRYRKTQFREGKRRNPASQTLAGNHNIKL
jgi:hypothetical protein